MTDPEEVHPADRPGAENDPQFARPDRFVGGVDEAEYWIKAFGGTAPPPAEEPPADADRTPAD